MHSAPLKHHFHFDNLPFHFLCSVTSEKIENIYAMWPVSGLNRCTCQHSQRNVPMKTVETCWLIHDLIKDFYIHTRVPRIPVWLPLHTPRIFQHHSGTVIFLISVHHLAYTWFYFFHYKIIHANVFNLCSTPFMFFLFCWHFFPPYDVSQ